MTMKSTLELLAALLFACCLAGCQKGDKDDANQNALVVTLAQDAQTIVYPIGSVFVGGGDLGDWTGNGYSFYRDKFTKYPRKMSLIDIEGRMFKGKEYTEPGQWIDLIFIRWPDESLGLGASLYIPMEQGVYKGGNDLISDVRIDSFQRSDSFGDIKISITTKSGDVIAIHYSGEVLPTGLY